MSEKRNSRSNKKQLGQFMTPIDLSKSIVSKLKLDKNSIILEPSFGDGSFIMSIIDFLINKNISLEYILCNILYGVEIDADMYDKTINKIKEKYGKLPEDHNLVNGDFFEIDFNVKFTHIIGNPPFGGTIDYKYQDELEKLFGQRYGMKIKKETYSFFKIKSIESLSTNGQLVFICSDTFLSIKTMNGLRNFLQRTGYTKIDRLNRFSDETNYPMVIIYFNKDLFLDYIEVDGVKIKYDLIKLTPNMSWSIDNSLSKFFLGDSLSKYITASGGLSTGKNELFVRDISDGKIKEKYKFEYFQDPITLEKELKKARLNKLGDKKKREIIEQEKNGICVENVKITKIEPIEIDIPNDDYLFYNKATNKIFYSKPENVIYWKDNGKAVLTFKKNGNWYLHGVGGQNFFKKEGITWQLISKKINARYLPKGYILDNSSPIAVLKDGVNKNELFFILGWLLTDLATSIQKNVINHTKNIQNKDIERLPYPFWVNDDIKQEVIKIVKDCIKNKYNDINFNEKEIMKKLNYLFQY